MNTKYKTTKLFTISTPKCDIVCYANPCISFSLQGASGESQLTTSYSFFVDGEYLDHHDPRRLFTDGVDYRGRKMTSNRGLVLDCLFPDMCFQSMAKAKACVPDLKNKINKVIEQNDLFKK